MPEPAGDDFSISGAIPDGSIEVVCAERLDDVQLRLLEDDARTVVFYYHFRASGVRGRDCTFRILNAGDTVTRRLAGRDGVTDHAWVTPGAMASYDLETWFRVPGTYANGVFSVSHRPDFDVCYYCSWPPYGIARAQALVARAQQEAHVRASVLGRSVEGRDIDCLTIGEGPHPCWIVARQHPSESMSSFFVEGFVERLLDARDPVIAALLEKCAFHVVPIVNPDGVARSFTRNNVAGHNLNRDWQNPDLEQSPEVFHIRQAMERTGVDFFLDCHGDRELDFVFLGGPLEIPSKSDRLDQLFYDFERAWTAVTPEYQLGHGYPGGAPPKADLAMAWYWVAERFNCLGLLLEQPFKDTQWRTDAVAGWSPERSVRFGASLPEAIFQIADRLR